jgi:hypothetical protein
VGKCVPSWPPHCPALSASCAHLHVQPAALPVLRQRQVDSQRCRTYKLSAQPQTRSQAGVVAVRGARATGQGVVLGDGGPMRPGMSRATGRCPPGWTFCAGWMDRCNPPYHHAGGGGGGGGVSWVTRAKPQGSTPRWEGVRTRTHRGGGLLLQHSARRTRTSFL